jgi:hypothetical protein
MRLASLLVLSACYRGEATPPVQDPLVQPEVACSSDDDLAHPVIDGGAGRLRMHSTAPLTAVRRRAGGREWIGPPVPDFLPKKVGTLELMLLDHAAGGYLALYRDPYNAGSCQLGDQSNCDYQVRHYRDGKLAWSLSLNKLLSRADHLEIQDVRLSGGVLYFNEACQSYSNEAGGDCSSLVAVDPVAKRVLWRTGTLVSNNRFFVRGCYIVAGYGFTSEPDALHLVDRRNGRVVQKLPVSSAPNQYKSIDPIRLDVELYSGLVRRFRFENVLAANGKLVPLDPDDPDAYGGAAYGGAAYGGATYAP